MAARSKSAMSTRRNEKRNTEPMYLKRKYITMSNDILGYRNQNSSRSMWKSNVDDVTSEKVFLERRNLISQWYQSWNETQRKRFFDFILDQSSYPELKFILGWFKTPVCTQQDFSKLLPRVVSTHIFSYLDPRSLCRAASVSWHWKWLVEQDSIWKRKCLKFGWYLPYRPSELENGAWKKHYVMCIRTLDIEVPQKSANRCYLEVNLLRDKYGKIIEALTPENDKIESDIAAKAYKKWKKNVSLVHKDEPIRPPWIANSSRPKELEHAEKALFGKFSPGKPTSLTTQQTSYRLGRRHSRSKTSPSQITGYVVHGPNKQLLKRSKSEEFSLSSKEVPNSNMLTLSETMPLDILDQKGMVDTDINENVLENISLRTRSKVDSYQLYSHDETKTNFQEFSLAYPDMVNPRVIIISSQISAHELLANAVIHGVLPIVYEYEGTTLSSLLDRFTAVLQGRKARSVGLFTGGESGSLELVRECTISLSSLNDPEVQTFWQSLTINIALQDQGGHVDIFYPLGGTDAGMELLNQLQVMTGLTFSSPTGIASTLNTVSDDDSWLAVPEKIDKPPSLYFNYVKLTAWSRAAQYIQESLSKVRIDLSGHFQDEIYGLAANIVGEIMFKTSGLVDMSELQDVGKILVKALVLMTQKKHVEKAKPITNLIHCLQEYEKEQKPRKNRAKTKNKKAPLDEKEPSRRDDIHSEDDFNSEDEHFKLNEQTTNVNLTDRLPLGERRSVIAHEILSTEKEYCNILSIIQDVFRKPLEASVKANRPVIGSANIRMIFNDSESLLKVNKELESDLSCRLPDWDSHQCLGDVFLKFNTKFKAYVNFLNNYPITLATIDKCQKQHPAFRSFLLQLENQASTKLSSLPNLLLAPTKRIHEYICLLESFLHHTPVEHKDHTKLTKAIEQLKQLKSLFDEASTRLRREKRLKEIQQQINNCPALVERGRYFIKQEDVVHLKQTESNDVKAEFRYKTVQLYTTELVSKTVSDSARVFQNIGNLGLFLFNDCLILAVKNLVAMPFQRILEVSYKYHLSLPLSTLKLEEVNDTKYVKNTFIITTGKRNWICQAKSAEAKYNWISLLNNCKRTTIVNKKNSI